MLPPTVANEAGDDDDVGAGSNEVCGVGKTQCGCELAFSAPLACANPRAKFGDGSCEVGVGKTGQTLPACQSAKWSPWVGKLVFADVAAGLENQGAKAAGLEETAFHM